MNFGRATSSRGGCRSRCLRKFPEYSHSADVLAVISYGPENRYGRTSALPRRAGVKPAFPWQFPCMVQQQVVNWNSSLFISSLRCTRSRRHWIRTASIVAASQTGLWMFWHCDVAWCFARRSCSWCAEFGAGSVPAFGPGPPATAASRRSQDVYRDVVPKRITFVTSGSWRCPGDTVGFWTATPCRLTSTIYRDIHDHVTAVPE